MRPSRSQKSVSRTLAVRSRQPVRPKRARALPAAPPLHPRGPYPRSLHPRYDADRSRDGWRWLRFRKAVGLEDTREVARLLDVTVKTIRRYEYGGEAPRWYQAALVGLAAVHGQHLGGDRGLERA